MAKKSKKIKESSSIDDTIKDINKIFKHAVVRKAIDRSEKLAVVPTGIKEFDKALDIGGFPRGRIVELYGDESLGKTTLALQIVARFQKNGLPAAYIDMEHALDIPYVKKLGVDCEKLMLAQPSCGEEALNILEYAIKTKAFRIIVVDSVAMLIPQVELEGETGTVVMGVMARNMGQCIRKIGGVVSENDVTVIFINQVRANIAIGGYGPSETTPGGRALRFAAHLRIRLKTGKRIDKTHNGEKRAVARKVYVGIIKSKLGTPLKNATLILKFGSGFVNSLDKKKKDKKHDEIRSR